MSHIDQRRNGCPRVVIIPMFAAIGLFDNAKNRWEKKPKDYLAFLAYALIAFRVAGLFG